MFKKIMVTKGVLTFGFVCSILLGLLSGCGSSNVNYAQVAKTKLGDFSNPMPFLGDYTRQYNILDKAHTMQLSFDENSGTLKTSGQLLNQDARFTTLGYDPKAKRWLGVSDAGSLLLIFWGGSASDSEIKIYKRFFPLKSKSKDSFLKKIDEVTALARPEAGDNTYTGWNTLHKGNSAPLDNTLPYLGKFIAIPQKDNTPRIKEFTFTDNALSINGMDIKKLSYHTGDRRWVGQVGERFALMFLNPTSEADTFDISFSLYDNHKYLYNAKPDEVRPRYWFTYKRVPVKN